MGGQLPHVPNGENTVAFADSNRASLRYIAEDPNAWGVTPASGTPREMRITSSKLAAKKETKTSEELRSDRMVPNIIEVGASAEGDVNGEFSSGAMDDFLAAFVYGLWSKPMTMDAFQGVGVSIATTSRIDISGYGDIRNVLTVGRKLKLEGWTTKANNCYVTISALALSGSTVQVTVAETGTLVIEAGTTYSRVIDANDVLVSSTAIRFGTGGASAIDSNGGNAFSAAIAAGQLKVGQKIHIDGLGFDAGTVTFGSVAAVGDTLTINDGEFQVTFQFGGSVPPGYVNVSAGADATASGANLAAAINLAVKRGDLSVYAASAVGVVTITNLNNTNGSLAKTGTPMTVVDFTGGDDSLRGVFTVTSVANDVVGILPAPATNANSGNKKIIVKGSMLRNPSVYSDFVRQSFTIETSFEDVNQHFVASGLRVGSFSMDVKSGEIVTFDTTFMGRAMERRVTQTSLLRNSPYTPAASTPHEIMNATTNVGNITKNGEALATALQSIMLKGDAKLREQRAVGSKYARGIGVGRFALTGSFTAYFETSDMFDDFVQHNTISLGFYFQDVDKFRYEVTLPAIKLTSDPVSPGKIDEDVVEEIEFEAQRDPATQCMIQFDRFSSVKTPLALV
jgi:hypothetical protein